MKCKYCGKKGVQLKHYAQKHQKQLQAARRRHAGKSRKGHRGSSKHRGGQKSSTVGTGGYSKLTLTFHD
jgi:hypothetical protein